MWNMKYLILLLFGLMLSACAGVKPSPISTAETKASSPLTGLNLDSLAFKKRWFGVGFKETENMKWKMEIDLSNNAHRVSYMDMECYGDLTLQKMEGEKATFSQKFYVGTDACKEMVTVTLQIIDDHSIHYHSYNRQGKETAVGMLVL
ncbi:MAG: hypothetical protein Q9M28_05740 [Mariprofundaceae bacterium]|nr:hypothetical protein [Mariprofundaceae bacterium]